MRARIDVSEIEAKTKIRAKYLRALENEEWGLLPGPTFVKSFLRTYAQALEPRRQGARRGVPAAPRAPERGDARADRLHAAEQRARGRARSSGIRVGGPSRGYMIAVGAIGVVIVVLIVLLVTGGGSANEPSQAASTQRRHARRACTRRHTRAHGSPSSPARVASELVALSLQADARSCTCA